MVQPKKQVFARRKKFKRQGRFRSNFELLISKQLIEAGAQWKYEITKYDYFLPINGEVICETCGRTRAITRKRYLPDFFLSNGVVIEGKGRLTVPDRKKLEAVRKYNPKLDLRILFYYNRKLNAKGERYSDWAEKHGIPWAVTTIPEEWLLHSDQPFPRKWDSCFGGRDVVVAPKRRKKKSDS
jgi:hypothetical protein